MVVLPLQLAATPAHLEAGALEPRCTEEVSFLNAYANQVEAILIIL